MVRYKRKTRTERYVVEDNGIGLVLNDCGEGGEIAGIDVGQNDTILLTL